LISQLAIKKESDQHLDYYSVQENKPSDVLKYLRDYRPPEAGLSRPNAAAQLQREVVRRLRENYNSRDIGWLTWWFTTDFTQSLAQKTKQLVTQYVEAWSSHTKLLPASQDATCPPVRVGAALVELRP